MSLTFRIRRHLSSVVPTLHNLLVSSSRELVALAAYFQLLLTGHASYHGLFHSILLPKRPLCVLRRCRHAR